MEETYCVYKHTCPNGKSYVGIAKNAERRWNYGHGYDTQLFGRAVRKYGWANIKHEIVFDGLTQEEAQSKEIALIEELNLTDRANGYNVMLGGQLGTKGIVFTEETRRKMSENSKRTWANPKTRARLLKHLAELSKQNKGRKMPRSAVQATKEAQSIKVDQYDLNGNLVKTHDSMMDAARELGKDCNSAIVASCKGRKKSYCGSIWKYHGDPLGIEELEFRTSRKSISVPIVMCDQNWNELKQFDGFHDAGRKLGINYKAIFCALKTGGNCNGYKWRYAAKS